MEDLWSDPSVGCDLSVLPEILAYPRLPDYRTLIERYQMMGLVRDANLHAALYELDRADYALPEVAILEESLSSSALLVPWHEDSDLPGSLIPGHFDIVQLLEMFDAGAGDDVLVIGPRGGFICALLDEMGARPVGVEPYGIRIPYIQSAVPHLEIRGIEDLKSKIGCLAKNFNRNLRSFFFARSFFPTFSRSVFKCMRRQNVKN